MRKLRAAALSLSACGFAMGAAAVPIAFESLEDGRGVGSQLAGMGTAVLATNGLALAYPDFEYGRDDDLQLEQETSSSNSRNLQLNRLILYDAPVFTLPFDNVDLRNVMAEGAPLPRPRRGSPG